MENKWWIKMDWITLTQLIASLALVVVTIAYSYETWKMRNIEEKKIKYNQLPDKVVASAGYHFRVYGSHNLYNVKAFLHTSDGKKELELTSLGEGGPTEDTRRKEGGIIPMLEEMYSFGLDDNDKEELEYLTLQGELINEKKVIYKFRKQDRSYFLENIIFK